MKKSASEQSFYTESEEENEEKELNRDEEEGGGEVENGVFQSYSDDSLMENQQDIKPGSYTTSWPQSFRQSIDLYSSIPSPNVLLGTPTLSRFGSSFLSRRHTPESLIEPLTSKQEHEKFSSHSLHPLPSRMHSIKEEKPSTGHGLPISRQSSYGQAVLNGMNVLCGVGILSTPYAAKEGGWLGLSILIIFAVLSFYTGMLLRKCLDSEPGLETYPDIGQAAFGTFGRTVVSIVLYAELYANCVEFIILGSDNLSSLFPNANLNLGGFELNSHHLFALMTTLAVLPTVWLRDLSVLSYISAGGVIASVLVVICLFWVGLVDKVSTNNTGTVLNIGTLPVAIGLYGFCYSGHAIFPNIYTSMAQPNKYPAVLLTCFAICTLLYAGAAVMGYKMFGESTASQFTLNMPQNLIASKIAAWTTVVNPFTKYALTMSPVAMSLEELIPSNHTKSHVYSICIRTALVISTLLVGLSIPFFGLLMSLIGSLLAMLVALILPCACFLRILRGKVTRFQAAFCLIIITVGVISAVFGTYSAISKIVESLSN